LQYSGVKRETNYFPARFLLAQSIRFGIRYRLKFHLKNWQIWHSSRNFSISILTITAGKFDADKIEVQLKTKKSAAASGLGQRKSPS